MEAPLVSVGKKEMAWNLDIQGTFSDPGVLHPSLLPSPDLNFPPNGHFKKMQRTMAVLEGSLQIWTKLGLSAVQEVS